MPAHLRLRDNAARSLRTIAVLSFLGALSTPVLPRTALSEEPEGHKVVLLASKSSPEESAKIIEAIRSSLAEIDVTVVEMWLKGPANSLREEIQIAKRAAEEEHALLTIWCDFEGGQELFLFLADTSGGRILVRKVSASEEGLQGRYEAMAIIARGTVSAMLRGGEIGVALPPQEQISQGKIKTEAATKSEGEPLAQAPRTWIAAGYALSWLSSEKVVSHGGWLQLRLALQNGFGLLVGDTLKPSAVIEGQGVALAMKLNDVDAGLSFERGRVWSLHLRAAAVFRFATWQAFSSSPQLTAESGRTDVLFGVRARVGCAYALTEHLRLELEAGALVLLQSRRYGAVEDGSRRMLIEPWFVQPDIALGLAVALPSAKRAE